MNVVEVFRGTRQDCLERTLTLDAAGIRHAIEPMPDGFAILVADHDAAKALDELQAYALENAVPRELRPAPGIRRIHGGWPGVVGYCALLILIYLLREQSAGGLDWLSAGRAQSDLIRGGHVWRTITALTLHVEPAHLIGNIVFGGLIGLFAGQVFGSGLAWLSILLAGGLGNLLSASIKPDGYSAIGASTGVFAALGMLAAHAWVGKWRANTTTLSRYTPIVGGIVLLSYLGSGGERTDVIAHIAGFGVGTLVGALHAKTVRMDSLGRLTQVFLGGTAFGIVTLAWICALS